MKSLVIFLSSIVLSVVCYAEPVIVYEREDGGVSIVYPDIRSGLAIGQIMQKDVPARVRARVIDRNLIPTNRERRNEWTYSDTNPGGIITPASVRQTIRIGSGGERE